MENPNNPQQRNPPFRIRRRYDESGEESQESSLSSLIRSRSESLEEEARERNPFYMDNGRRRRLLIRRPKVVNGQVIPRLPIFWDGRIVANGHALHPEDIPGPPIPDGQFTHRSDRQEPSLAQLLNSENSRSRSINSNEPSLRNRILRNTQEPFQLTESEEEMKEVESNSLKDLRKLYKGDNGFWKVGYGEETPRTVWKRLKNANKKGYERVLDHRSRSPSPYKPMDSSDFEWYPGNPDEKFRGRPFVNWVKTGENPRGKKRFNCMEGVCHYIDQQNPDIKFRENTLKPLLQGKNSEEAAVNLIGNLYKAVGYPTENGGDEYYFKNKERFSLYPFNKNISKDRLFGKFSESPLKPGSVVSFGDPTGDLHVGVVSHDNKFRSLWKDPYNKGSKKFSKYPIEDVIMQVKKELSAIEKGEKISPKTYPFATAYISNKFT
ncbi:MAG: hypothetical protein P0S93_06585 [Candidatus Neptunochlamydia sp.]|nr:hypothetical protein [Candidatus Neptunochlamydia sp.]